MSFFMVDILLRTRATLALRLRNVSFFLVISRHDRTRGPTTLVIGRGQSRAPPVATRQKPAELRRFTTWKNFVTLAMRIDARTVNVVVDWGRALG
jgi:hypothetical protein